MPGKYRGTKDDVKIKIARVLVQVRSSYLTTYPLYLTDIMNMASYNPNAGNGWQDVGLTIQPVTESDGFDKADIVTQQFGKINIRKGDYARTVTVAPAEQSQLTRELAKGGVDYNDDATREERRMFYTNTKDETVYRIAVVNFDDETTNIDATVFPRVKRSGDATERTWDKDNAQDYPITFEVFTDPQILDAGGEEVAVYDIWQY